MSKIELFILCAGLGFRPTKYPAINKHVSIYYWYGLITTNPESIHTPRFTQATVIIYSGFGDENKDNLMIRGLIAPILSPFNEDLSFDCYLQRLCKNLLASGCSGLAPFGTTGEAMSISTAERRLALEGLVGSGIDPSVLIPGTGLCNLPESVELAQHATDLDEGVAVLPPFYFKDVSQQGLLDYYEGFIERVNRTVLRIYLYHIPQVSGVGLSIDLIKTLREKYPTIIVGIKDSSGDWTHTEQLLLMEDFIVYPGSELPLVEAMSLGFPAALQPQT